MTPKCERLLEEMMESGDSQALAVADCLQTIASNGDEQGEDAYLVGCAEQIKEWADYFILQMSKKKKGR